MFVSLLINKARGWLLYWETVRQLRLLSDRNLLDIGIDRHRIRKLAHTAAFKKSGSTETVASQTGEIRQAAEYFVGR